MSFKRPLFTDDKFEFSRAKSVVRIIAFRHLITTTMDRLNQHCLEEIFNRLDLQSRVEASRTCKLWRELLHDPKATKGVDVSEIRIEQPASESDQANSSIETYQIVSAFEPDQDLTGYRFTDNLDSILIHIGRCDRIEIAPKAVDHISAPCGESIGNHLERFGESTMVRIDWDGTVDDGRRTTINLDNLPLDSIEHLALRRCPSGFPFPMFDDDGPMEQLKHMDLHIRSVAGLIAMMDLPSSLPSLAFSWETQQLDDEISHELNSRAARDFLIGIKYCDALEEFDVNGIDINGFLFHELIKIVRQRLFQLNRMRFSNVAFREYTFLVSHAKEIEPMKHPSPNRSMTMDRLEFDSCAGDWIDALRKLLELFRTRTVSIELAPESELGDVQKIYDLVPTMEKFGTDLELSINSIDRPRDLSELLIPSELRHVLVKLELISLHHSNYLKTMLDEPYERLIEIHVRNCIEMDDADLRAVARWCPNLRKLTFEPHASSGRDVVTRRCFSPFLEFWSQRNSRQLSITCSDSAFGKLDPSTDLSGIRSVSYPWVIEKEKPEKGVLVDGKKWMRFRKMPTAISLSDLVHSARAREKYRLVVWEVDSDGNAIKSLVIKDYAKLFRTKVRIQIADGGFYWKEMFDYLS